MPSKNIGISLRNLHFLWAADSNTYVFLLPNHIKVFRNDSYHHYCVCVSSGPPRVSEKIAHRQMARLGSAIKLPCPVEGDPPPLIMWTKDGRNIHSGWIRFRMLRMGLKIKEVEADDTGTYICKATNGFGSVNINYTLIVIGECRWSCVCITLDSL